MLWLSLTMSLRNTFIHITMTDKFTRLVGPQGKLKLFYSPAILNFLSTTIWSRDPFDLDVLTWIIDHKTWMERRRGCHNENYEFHWKRSYAQSCIMMRTDSIESSFLLDSYSRAPQSHRDSLWNIFSDETFQDFSHDTRAPEIFPLDSLPLLFAFFSPIESHLTALRAPPNWLTSLCNKTPSLNASHAQWSSMNNQAEAAGNEITA